jgi:3',5'-cyclic AMP phosphodiesterase CpdA
VHFSLAHFSDVHLGPLNASDVLQHFKLKRVIGGASWAFRRRKLHRTAVSDAIKQSIIAAKPDHMACTGDMINIAAWPEFLHAEQWLNTLSSPQTMSFVPGNHDCYVDVPYAQGLRHFAPWMQGQASTPDAQPQFPYVHLRRNIALIGLNSGAPQALHRASGTIGEKQCRDLGHTLERLDGQGFCRIVMIHHPPLPGLARPRKALRDAAALQDVLKQTGCELVLHGHNHHFMHNRLETKSGLAHVIGAPSASIAPREGHESAGWNAFRIRRQAGEWQIELTRHVWRPETGTVDALTPALLSPA